MADAVQVNAALQQVRGKAVPQRVDAADLGNAGGLASRVVVKLRTAAVQRPGRIAAAGKQLVLGLGTSAAGAPVQAQLVEQLEREKTVAVLSALALDHTDTHAVRC